MKQLSFFSQSGQEKSGHQWWAYVDGASRKNPGPAGAGIYILKDGIPFYQDGFFLGTKTNNQAEYTAVLVALFFLKTWCTVHDTIRLISDSELLVQQLRGKYKVRNEGLRPLHSSAINFLRGLTYDVVHVPREENAHADKMANQGVDTKKPLPPKFIMLMQESGITF